MNRQADEIRSEVSRDYANRISASKGCGCKGQDPQNGPLAGLAGYTDAELATVPDGMADSSFACGNPLAHAGLKEGDVVLDLGSGAGLDLLLAAQKVGPAGRVIGVDMTDAMIARAQENIRAAGVSNVELRKGFIETLPVEDASVDWVISNCVINLSPEKESVFHEIVRVLKPGGAMVVSDIMAKNLPVELLAIPALYSSCIAGAISEEDYLAGLRKAGMADLKVLDRLVYGSGQIESYAEEALGDAFPVTPEIAARVGAYAHKLAGRIWSAKIYARKPL